MIHWNVAHIANVNFDVIGYMPPTKYHNEFFDIIYGISVFTHIESDMQMSTYNTFDSFRKLLERKFKILEYYDGPENEEKVGGQDLWIMQKK